MPIVDMRFQQDKYGFMLPFNDFHLWRASGRKELAVIESLIYSDSFTGSWTCFE